MTNSGSVNAWRAIGLPEVSENVLRQATAEIGLDWKTCGHVTATEASARWLRKSGVHAISIVELTDLIVSAGLPQGLKVEATTYPTLDIHSKYFADELLRFNSELRKWRSNIGGQKAGFALRIDNTLRTYLRKSAADAAAGNVLRTAIRELRKSIMFLIASNFVPRDFATDQPLLKVAVDAWTFLESEISEVTNIRRDLWDSPDALSSPSSNAELELAQRVEAALLQVFGKPESQWQLLYHGFYFYTPQQWALWQLLKGHSKIHQCFVVHDDGTNRAFETWRHFFIERWLMPPVKQMSMMSSDGRATALRDALEGRKVDGVALGSDTEVIGFNNPTEFVRHWRVQRAGQSDETKPRIFAPAHKELDRVIDRMSPGQTPTTVNLANLPVGQFLLALHECIEFAMDSSPELVFTGERLVDMAASGYLDLPSDEMHPSEHIDALRRALPFFSNLRLATEWEVRAQALERLVRGEVSALGPRSDGQTDVARMSGGAANELRLVPWCDLTDGDARAVLLTVRSAANLGRELIRDGGRKPNDYLSWIRQRLERAMSKLSKEQQEQIATKLGGIQIGLTGDLDLEGVKEVVQIILGREVEFGLYDEGDGSDDQEVENIRFLDVLGLGKSEVDIHVASLSEAAFPARTQPIGWPFSFASLNQPAGRRFVSAEILRARAETSQLGDLYLFWLALAGVAPGRKLTLSWIKKDGNELQNPSSLLTLLTRPSVRDQNVINQVGGVTLGQPLRDKPNVGGLNLPESRDFEIASNKGKIRAAAEKMDRIAASSGILCSRRMVIQWALGPSHAFSTEHTQSMLYGNVYGVLVKRRRFLQGDAASRDRRILQLVNDLWRHFTPGQRRSSMENRRVKLPGASWQWVFSLGGSKDGTGAFDNAYRAAREPSSPIPIESLLGTDVEALLPPPGPSVTSRICVFCPVSSRCASRVR